MHSYTPNTLLFTFYHLFIDFTNLKSYFGVLSILALHLWTDNTHISPTQHPLLSNIFYRFKTIVFAIKTAIDTSLHIFSHPMFIMFCWCFSFSFFLFFFLYFPFCFFFCVFAGKKKERWNCDFSCFVFFVKKQLETPKHKHAKIPKKCAK